MLRTELAWAAGFFDGEGSTKKKYYGYKTKKGFVKKPTKDICMTIAQCDRRPLLRFKKAVGNLGCINGPYQYAPNKRPYWIWSTAGGLAEQVFTRLKNYLCQNKKNQYRQVKKETFPLPNRKKGWTYDN